MEVPLKFAWAGLVYLLAGSTMGAVMVLYPSPLVPSHAHILLIGCVSIGVRLSHP